MKRLILIYIISSFIYGNFSRGQHSLGVNAGVFIDFEEEVKLLTGLDRPREGDLIFFPLSKTLFEIGTWVWTNSKRIAVRKTGVYWSSGSKNIYQ